MGVAVGLEGEDSGRVRVQKYLQEMRGLGTVGQMKC